MKEITFRSFVASTEAVVPQYVHKKKLYLEASLAPKVTKSQASTPKESRG